MATVHELAAESIGRVTRRGLEPQLEQAERALEPRERPLVLAHGHEGRLLALIVVTDRRVLLASAAPFAPPELESVARDQLGAVTAVATDAGWILDLPFVAGSRTITGMADRDAGRIASALAPVE